MRRCEICGGLISEGAHHRRKICFLKECKKERARRLDIKYRMLKREKIEMHSIEPPPARQRLAGGQVKHKSGRPNEKEERRKMFDRLKKNPRDPEVRKYLKRKSISFIRLSLGKGRKIEVRV